MGMKEQLANAHSAADFMPAITELSVLVLVCFVVGYLLLTRGIAEKAPWAFWSVVCICGATAAIGLVLIGVDYFRSPQVHAYVDPNDDFTALKTEPPLNLAAYLNDQINEPLAADKDQAKPVRLEAGMLRISIKNFDGLKSRLNDLSNQNEGGQTMKNLFVKACEFVPPSSQDLYRQCQIFRVGYQP